MWGVGGAVNKPGSETLQILVHLQPSMIVHACNPKIKDEEARGSGVQGYPQLYSKEETTKGSALNKNFLKRWRYSVDGQVFALQA